MLHLRPVSVSVLIRLLVAITLVVTLGVLHEQPSPSTAAAIRCSPLLRLPGRIATCYLPVQQSQAESQFPARLPNPLVVVLHLTGLRLSQLLVLHTQAPGGKPTPGSGLVYLFGALQATGSTALCAVRPTPRYLLLAEVGDSHTLAQLRWPCAWQARATLAGGHLVVAVSANGNRALAQTLVHRLTTPAVPTPSPGAIAPAGTAVSEPATVTTGSTGPAPASPTPYPGTVRTITRADGGQTVHLAVGDRFLLDLDLGSFFLTRVQVDDPLTIAQVPGALVPAGAQGIFAALRPGQTTLTVLADPVCRTAQPPCEAPSLAFMVHLIVGGVATIPTATATSTPLPAGTSTPTAPQDTATPLPGNIRTLTFAENGQTIPLAVGDQFLLNLGLGDAYVTTIHIDDPAIVSQVDAGPLPPGSQGVFQANAPGKASLTVTGDPRCYPACLLPSFWFHVLLRVQ